MANFKKIGKNKFKGTGPKTKGGQGGGGKPFDQKQVKMFNALGGNWPKKKGKKNGKNKNKTGK